ncbi:hypothetical protein [Thermococcus sp. GR6]|uniref:hypothetical protein n=1 Tax=Thermococcus sp. GR6 TaxID=1638256 RepID=UPI00143029F1|nr:hypothetical protein [Thermococcus sp. GR6]NJE42446.1 hypothetical protein [Thermococcus sp. GR6]
METYNFNVNGTLKNRKFIALMVIAILVTYAIPFPFISGFLDDYSRLKDVERQMGKENEAIVCHEVYDVDPDFFGEHGFTCNDEYYRPGEPTTSCCGMHVYRDTYGEYLQVKESLREELPGFVAFVIFAFLAVIVFSYALIDLAVRIGRGELDKLGIKDSVLKGLHALPGLVVSEAITFVVVLIVLILLAIPIAIFGPFGTVIASILAVPAFVLVIPAYYFTKKIGPVGEIWRVAKTNPGGYLTLGLGFAVVDALMVFQYEYYLGIGTLLLMLLTGTIRYLLNSAGALMVYMEGTKEEESV